MEILDEFKKHGLDASYHYADDSGSEWSLAHISKNKAIALFDSNPNQQDEMRNIATQFLWSLKNERPE